MTGRTLTATPRPLPDETAALGPDPLKDPEVRFWMLVDELFDLGKEYGPLAERLRKLEAQLADPALADHPKRTEAFDRYVEWTSTADHIEATARNARGWLAHCWQQIPRRRQKELQAAPDFPRAASPERIAGECWEAAKRGRAIPGRCPF